MSSKRSGVSLSQLGKAEVVGMLEYGKIVSDRRRMDKGGLRLSLKERRWRDLVRFRRVDNSGHDRNLLRFFADHRDRRFLNSKHQSQGLQNIYWTMT